jgi:hypothetical protein
MRFSILIPERSIIFGQQFDTLGTRDPRNMNTTWIFLKREKCILEEIDFIISLKTLNPVIVS